jgi:two-component system chemotaxis response regulator CheB
MTLTVLVADDSPTSRCMLVHIIGNAPDMQVIAEATNGHQAVRMACDLKPDVILMDLTMPGMNGLEATREIMHLAPTPIIVVSASLERQETDNAFQSIKAGALAAIAKPVGPHSANHASQVATLLSTIKAMAGVRVIHHWKSRERAKIPANNLSGQVLLATIDTSGALPQVSPKIVAIASSTGGPGALAEILQSLPANFTLPIVIVQHIAADFLPSLQHWLAGLTPLNVQIAQAGSSPLPGHVYLAPGNAHLKLSAASRFELDPKRGEHGHMPAANVLLGSVAKVYGAEAVGIVLTGMGNDGARGLRMMHDAGAYTIAQDEQSSVVYGMPREAAAIGAAKRVLPLSIIPSILCSITDTGLKQK